MALLPAFHMSREVVGSYSITITDSLTAMHCSRCETQLSPLAAIPDPENSTGRAFNDACALKQVSDVLVGGKGSDPEMRKQEFVGWLCKKVPRALWEQVWWQVPIIMLLILPVGTVVFYFLGHLGWYGAAQATQGLMVVSVFGGPIIWCSHHMCIEEADLPPPSSSREMVRRACPYRALSLRFFL